MFFRQTWYPAQAFDDGLPTIKSLTKTKNEPGKRSVRRAAMLNKMFMKQITDLMSTGTVAMDVLGRGIEISKVCITILNYYLLKIYLNVYVSFLYRAPAMTLTILITY